MTWKFTQKATFVNVNLGIDLRFQIWQPKSCPECHMTGLFFLQCQTTLGCWISFLMIFWWYQVLVAMASTILYVNPIRLCKLVSSVIRVLKTTKNTFQSLRLGNLHCGVRLHGGMYILRSMFACRNQPGRWHTRVVSYGIPRGRIYGTQCYDLGGHNYIRISSHF